MLPGFQRQSCESGWVSVFPLVKGELRQQGWKGESKALVVVLGDFQTVPYLGFRTKVSAWSVSMGHWVVEGPREAGPGDWF